MRLSDIIRKDILVVLRDVKALIFILLMPIVLMVILGLALGGIFQSGFSIGTINVAVVDHTKASEAAAAEQSLLPYTDSFDAEMISLYSALDSDEISSFLNYQITSDDDAQRLLDQGEIDAVITIPEGYLTDVAQSLQGGGTVTTVSVQGSKQSTLKTSIVAGIVKAYADSISSVSADFDVLLQTVLDSGSPALAQTVMGNLNIGEYVENSIRASASEAVSIQSKGIESRQTLNSFTYYAIAITCMFMLYSSGQGSSFLYTESEEKTLQRLSAAGVSTKKLLLGKSAAVFILCLVQLTVLFAFSTLAFDIDWGNALGLVIISVCAAISVTGLGVLLMVMVYRTANPRIGTVFQSILVQVLALFGGSYIPLSILPKFFSVVSLITPNGLAVNAYTENVTGASLLEILPYLAGSVALGAVLYFIGVLLFPRERRA